MPPCSILFTYRKYYCFWCSANASVLCFFFRTTHVHKKHFWGGWEPSRETGGGSQHGLSLFCGLFLCYCTRAQSLKRGKNVYGHGVLRSALSVAVTGRTFWYGIYICFSRTEDTAPFAMESTVSLKDIVFLGGSVG